MLAPRGMTRQRRRAGRRERRNRLFRWALLVLVLAVVFFAGLAIGKALEKASRPGGSQTRIRTLEPRTIAPAERTVTVTTAS
jgi:flagellar biogenesis protein FliO